MKTSNLPSIRFILCLQIGSYLEVFLRILIASKLCFWKYYYSSSLFESDFSLIVLTGIKLCYNFFKEIIEASDLNNPSASPDVRVL